MKRRNIVTLIAYILLSMQPIAAQMKQKLDIKAATFFLSGASLTSTAHITLAQGEHEVLFTNIAGNIDQSSILVNATNGVIAEGTSIQTNYMVSEGTSPKAKAMMDSIEIITGERSYVVAKISLLTEQITIFQNNRTVTVNSSGSTVAELSKMIAFADAKLSAIMNEKIRQEAILKKTDDHIAALRNEVEEERKKNYLQGTQLLVTFYANEDANTDVTVTYNISAAGWAPAYDIMSASVNAPVKLYYKAYVYQNSGLKWEGIHITLSTGNPNESVQAPAMAAQYLTVYAPPAAYQNQATVIAYKKPMLSRDEINTIPTTQTADMVNSTPGMYQSQRGSSLNMSGARNTGTMYIVDGVQVIGQSSVNGYTSVNSIGINTTFNIDLPYTIPSDGKQHMITIKKYEMPATYRYYAVPKLDKDVFLQAQITGWEEMNLLPAQTNIFYEGVYVGRGYINIRNNTDTMLLSLGRDKKVIVKRETDKELRSSKLIGSNIREAFAYSISVHNTRKSNIDVIIQDQVPVSNDNSITIEDPETPGADFDAGTGLVKWTYTIQPGETKKVNFGFTVKYPKDKQLIGLR